MLLPAWSSHSNDLERLQQAWQTDFEKRAKGAFFALSGFHYQFLVTLHDTLRAWLQRSKIERARPSVFSECLSDILDKSSNDILLVSQIKSTLRHDGLRHALTEFWLIYELAFRITPNLVPYLRFRILSKKTESKNIETVLDEWRPEEEHLANLDLEVFRRSVTVVDFFDPKDEILALLANELNAPDPTGYLDQWLSKLLSAASRGAFGFEDAAEEIWNSLESIEKSGSATPAGIHVWTSQDKPPEQTKEGGILTGDRPQIHHLREGYFAVRSGAYNHISAEVEGWMNRLSSERDKQLRLQIFWIGGRSGSGKSIALLHVLASLYESGIGPLLWLGNKTELLRQAMPWALKLRSADRQVIIGIDDPYAPNTQSNDIVWKETLAALESIRQSGDPLALPLIICCGPTEQGERMQEDLSDDVNIYIGELPKEERDDFLHLRDWYVERTKKQPPNIGDENLLLVQLFFQWKTGQDLRQFSSRFRNRIRESDPEGKLEDFITRLLCANRLYIGYPTTAVEERLTPSLQDTFRRLREEHHVKETITNSGTTLWLAHAHLSNSIYENWYPRNRNLAVRANHVRQVVADCFEFGASLSEKIAPLWAISNAVAKGTAQRVLVERLDEETVSSLLPSVYASRLQGSSASLPPSELPVWIQLRAHLPEEFLKPDPIDLAITWIKPEHYQEKGLRLTCHKLLQYCGAFSEQQRCTIEEVIINLLSETPSWIEWAPIAADAYQRTKDPRLLKLITDWVSGRPHSKWAEQLFLQVFNINHYDPQMRRVASDLLPRMRGELGWGKIALHLIEISNDEIPTPVLEWCSKNYRERGAGLVLGEVLRRGRRLVRRWAFDWCGRWHKERMAAQVLEPLLDSLGAQEKLRVWSLRWLAMEHPYLNTSYLLEKLLNTFPTDPEVQAMALQWLQANNLEHGSWQYIWRAFRKANPYESFAVVAGRNSLLSTSLPATITAAETELSANEELAQLLPHDPKAWFYLAIGLGKARRFEDEIDALQKATELNPKFAEAWQALGATYARVGRSEQALAATLQLAELTPDDPWAWYYLSIAYSRTGKQQERLDALIKATELDPHFAKAWWELRNVYEKSGDYDRALEAELRLGGSIPADCNAWYDLAIAYGRDRRQEAQISALGKAIELNPDFFDAWKALGAIYHQRSEHELALHANLNLTRLRPTAAEAWYHSAITYSKLEQYDDQITALTRAIQEDPQFTPAWQALGAAYNQRGEGILAHKAALRLTELQPEDADAWYYLSLSLSKLDNTEEQIAALIKAVELDPEFAKAWEGLAAACGQTGRLDIALNAGLQLTRLKPDEPESWQKLGAVYNRLGEAELAVDANLKLTALAPNDAQAWYYLAVAHNKAHKTSEQISSLQTAIKLDPQHGEAWQALGAYYNNTGQVELALEAAQKVVELRPNDAQCWYYLAISYNKVNQKKEELQSLIQATEIDPTCVDAWTSLAAIYFRGREYAPAIEAQTKVVALKPDDPKAQQKLEHMRTTMELLKQEELESEWQSEVARELYNIGKNYVVSGQRHEAVAAFRAVIKESGDQTEINYLYRSLINEARAAFHLEDYEKAIAFLEVVVTVNDSIAAAWELLSSSYRRARMDEAALNAALQVVALSPSEPYGWYKLGKRYAQLHRISEAKQALNQALSLDPDFKAPRRKLNSLVDES